MNSPNHLPVIIGFIGDLMFSTRLESTAEKLGFRAIFFENDNSFLSDDLVPGDIPYTQQPFSRGAMLVDKISAWQPAMIIFDLNNIEVPWQSWITLIKSSPATRRTAIICFGSHKEIGSLKSARDAGADVVLPRSSFVQKLPEIISTYARKLGGPELEESCQKPLSRPALNGLELFNQHEYFLAHEELEKAWIEDPSPGRELYRAILQVAVAYLQIERSNYAGAIKMFLRLRQWIEPLPDECRGVNVDKLRRDAQQVYQQLLASGREKISDFDRSLFKPIIFHL